MAADDPSRVPIVPCGDRAFHRPLQVAHLLTRYDLEGHPHAQHGPVIIVSFGACATSGGPYWDAPTVRPGIEALFPGQKIASYVPGCPPRPEALVVELERLVNSRIPA